MDIYMIDVFEGDTLSVKANKLLISEIKFKQGLNICGDNNISDLMNSVSKISDHRFEYIRLVITGNF